MVFAMIDFYESCDKRHRLSRYGNDYVATLSIKLWSYETYFKSMARFMFRKGYNLNLSLSK